MVKNKKIKRLWAGNTGGGTVGQRLLIIFFRWFNLRLGYAVMAVVVPFYMLFARKGYLAIYHYFRRHFDYLKWKSFLKTYQNHFFFGKIILDRFAVFAGKKQLFNIEIIGNEYFTELLNKDKGFVIIGSHVGNFEIAGYFLSQNKKTINAMIYGGETQTVQQNRSKLLSNNNINLISVKSDMSHLFAANTALQKGEIVSMPADRLFGSTKAVECDFLQGRADFPIGAFALAAGFDVEVRAIFCIKISSKKYKIYVIPIGSSGSFATKKEKINEMVFSYVKELENIVKQYPEQWFNFYEFWK
ncbi:MAG: lipid A biosynthesis (KDO)2-(lauroyl)-lipid IVA acyltransferase [Paludibacter sp.]|nr:lipid A biosynthesis (KDO)2-(lauroyl)-lipid IVA acyltransferase [Paludibacter sp.]